MIKYFNNLKLFPNCKYKFENNEYDTFLDAVNNSYYNPSNNIPMIQIEIINNFATNIHPLNLECTNYQSKDILAKYAISRIIYISIDKSEIYFEAFELEDEENSCWRYYHIYDYGFMYSDKQIISIGYSNIQKYLGIIFNIEIDPVSIGKGKGFKILSKLELLNSKYMNQDLSLKCTCYDKDDGDYLIPFSTIKEVED